MVQIFMEWLQSSMQKNMTFSTSALVWIQMYLPCLLECSYFTCLSWAYACCFRCVTSHHHLSSQTMMMIAVLHMPLSNIRYCCGSIVCFIVAVTKGHTPAFYTKKLWNGLYISCLKSEPLEVAWQPHMKETVETFQKAWQTSESAWNRSGLSQPHISDILDL